MFKSFLIAIAAMAFYSTVSTPAVAKCSSGFLANAACQAGIIDKQTANGLDAAHAAAGRPLDHLANQAAGAAANYFVPGSGPYVTQGLEYRDMYNRGQLPGQQHFAPEPHAQPMYRPLPQPVYAPPPYYAPPMYRPVPQPVYAPPPYYAPPMYRPVPRMVMYRPMPRYW
jgi:hypothetical protein